MKRSGWHRVATSRRAAGAVAALCAGVVLAAMPRAASARQASLPAALDLSVIRALPVQHDGRWPPLDTVARDCVESVTGEVFFQGQDPVVVFLSWVFDPETWQHEPLIPIRNAELRGELGLSPTQTKYSYAELVSHRPLRKLIDALAHVERGRKLNPLESKVSGLGEKLATLDGVFSGQVLRPIPSPEDPLGTWTSVAVLHASAADHLTPVHGAWGAVRRAFLKGDAPAFFAASTRLRDALAALPAAQRPDPKLLATELRFNRLRPFRTAWQIMVASALLAALALAVRRKGFDAVTAAVMIAGFVVLTYGLSLRWRVAGRIPAANMYESLLFLSWGMGALAICSMVFVRHRTVPLTASFMGALALFLADVLPVDHYIRPIPPVLMDTVWMSIHVPVIMVSYSVLALAMLVAHAQIVVMAVVPHRRRWVNAIDAMHYWYVHIGSILLLAGIVTGSMWAASSWGRYWGWDPKEVWSLIALLGYLTILHVRAEAPQVPKWAYAVGVLLAAAVFVLVGAGLAPVTATTAVSLTGAAAIVAVFVLARGPFATAVKSILAFWMILMTYLGVNYVLGIGLHSYGFGTGAMVRYMFLLGGIDVALLALCTVVHLARGGAGVKLPGTREGAAASRGVDMSDA